MKHNEASTSDDLLRNIVYCIAENKNLIDKTCFEFDAGYNLFEVITYTDPEIFEKEIVQAYHKNPGNYLSSKSFIDLVFEIIKALQLEKEKRGNPDFDQSNSDASIKEITFNQEFDKQTKETLTSVKQLKNRPNYKFEEEEAFKNIARNPFCKAAHNEQIRKDFFGGFFKNVCEISLPPEIDKLIQNYLLDNGDDQDEYVNQHAKITP